MTLNLCRDSATLYHPLYGLFPAAISEFTRISAGNTAVPRSRVQNLDACLVAFIITHPSRGQQSIREPWLAEAREELWPALPLSKQCSAPNVPFRCSAQSLDPSLFLGSERAFLVKQGGFLFDPLFPHLLSHQLQIFGSIFLPE